MTQHLERDVRFLKRYAVVSTTVFIVVSLAAFARPMRHEKFTEIDVERINVMEPDGKYRMVISNRPRSIGPIYKGKPFGYQGGGRPGIIFFNDEGTENGGLTFTGKDSAGRFRASTHMSFDQFNQDQVLNLDYTDNNGRRLVGISMLDRAQTDIHDLVVGMDSIRKAVPDSIAQQAAITRFLTPKNGEPFQAQRVFLGRNYTKAATLVLSDPNGRPRIRIAVDSAGTPALEFLDEMGRVTARLPEAKK